jgi:hypothetical protein
MRDFLHSVRSSLEAGLAEPRASAPFVYVTAIHSDAGLTRSLAGITLISREIGFEQDAETIYSPDAKSATFHAQHQEACVALAVEVCPARQTVSIAVSGTNNDETYQLFLEADNRLFGAC